MPACVCLEGPTWADVLQQQQSAQAVAHLWELRVDLLDLSAEDRLEGLVAHLRDRPLLLTDRSSSHGGRARNCSREQSQRRARLARLQPDYLDVEWPVESAELDRLARIAPHTEIVISWHGEQLPVGYQKALDGGAGLYPRIWKVAPTCPDAASWIDWRRWWSHHASRPSLQGKLLFQPQGPLGIVQRVFHAAWDQPWTFVSSSGGEGRITPDQWQHLYYLGGKGLEPTARVWGVVGDPVFQSRGPIVHNRWMAQSQWPGRYVPITCSAKDWPLLWPWLQEHAGGLAVTTPLKERVVPSMDHLEALAAAASAVNTCVRGPHGWTGLNTDGPAAVAAMGGAHRLQGQRVLVLGAGGVGRAVALACAQAGAEVTLLARRPEAVSETLHRELRIAPMTEWASLAPCMHWIVQATTCGFSDSTMPVDPSCLQGQSVLEIVQKQTPFSLEAAQRGCRVVAGVEMFVHLSRMQEELWRQEARII